MKDYTRKCLNIDLEVDSIIQEVKEQIRSKRDMFGCVVYAIRCTENGRMYIGCTEISMAIGNFKRLLLDASKNKYSNALMQRDFNLYGKHCFELIILNDLDCSGLGWEDSKQKYIEHFGGLGSKKLYNLTDKIHKSVSYFNTISNELKELKS